MPYGHIYLNMVELVCNLPDKVFWRTANGQMNQRDEEAELSQQTFLHGQTPGSSYNCWCSNFCWIPFGFYHLMLRRLYLESSPLQDIHGQDCYLTSAVMIRGEQRDVCQEVLPTAQQCLKETQIVGGGISDRLVSSSVLGKDPASSSK